MIGVVMVDPFEADYDMGEVQGGVLHSFTHVGSGSETC